MYDRVHRNITLLKEGVIDCYRLILIKFNNGTATRNTKPYILLIVYKPKINKFKKEFLKE